MTARLSAAAVFAASTVLLPALDASAVPYYQNLFTGTYEPNGQNGNGDDRGVRFTVGTAFTSLQIEVNADLAAINYVFDAFEVDGTTLTLLESAVIVGDALDETRWFTAPFVQTFEAGKTYEISIRVQNPAFNLPLNENLPLYDPPGGSTGSWNVNPHITVIAGRAGGFNDSRLPELRLLIPEPASLMILGGFVAMFASRRFQTK